ncbi:MAG: PAS domain S-box protein, partial [Actinomycetales bacterium]|nr:PAS domain S-box protein [Actinomycetales bacterium]
PEDAREVLRTLIFIEKQIPTKDGRWFSIRIMPYRTYDDRIDGLVITFINISELKMVEENLKKINQENRLFIDTSSRVILKLSANWQIMEFNLAAEIFFGKKREEVKDQDFMKLFIPETSRKKTEEEITSLLKKPGKTDIKMKVMAAGKKESEKKWTVNVLFNHLKIPTEIIIITINE